MLSYLGIPYFKSGRKWCADFGILDYRSFKTKKEMFKSIEFAENKKLSVHEKINYRSNFMRSYGNRFYLPYKNFNRENQITLISEPLKMYGFMLNEFKFEFKR